MKEFWNERYKNEEYAYGVEPNEFLKDSLTKLVPGKILFPCEGEGRNAVYASTLGWEVFAFDYSEEARKKAHSLAALKNVFIVYELKNIADFECNAPDYDVIVLVFAHFPPDTRQSIHQKLQDCLKPGGLLILEGFHKNQLGKPSGGPNDINMLFDAEMLRADFESLDIEELKETERKLEEGHYHTGEASLIQLIARKK